MCVTCVGVGVGVEKERVDQSNIVMPLICLLGSGADGKRQEKGEERCERKRGRERDVRGKTET